MLFTFRIRGCGCGKHPAFPAPSLARGPTIWQSPDKSCRGNAEVCVLVIPGRDEVASPESIRRSECCYEGWSTVFFEPTAACGYGFRARRCAAPRNDVKWLFDI